MNDSIEYSDYIVYVDEAGDHSLDHIDSNFPVFVLAFCIFKNHNTSTKQHQNYNNLNLPTSAMI